jgi:hypothetical protein
MNKQIWSDEGGHLYLTSPSKEHKKLDNAVYTVGLDGFGRFYLAKVSDNFDFGHKIYGLERNLVNRVIKTYNATKGGNLGVLLNGLKGTGKTVTSKIISNELNQPTILVAMNRDSIGSFINEIPQDITVFVDEYEKIFGDSSSLLTIMDGAFNSIHRRVFIMTTNKLYVDENMIQRPGRIRYLKKFDNLSPEVVEEIVDDVLVHKHFKKECIDFVSNLETITVDIVKAVITEVNIHEEAPSAFQDVFNVKKLKGKYNVMLREKDGIFTEVAKSVNIYPKPNYDDDMINHRFEIENNTIGTISRVINWTTFELSPYEKDNGEKLGFDGPIVIKIEDADVINYAYSYSQYGMGGAGPVQRPQKTISPFAKSIISSIHKAEDEDEVDTYDVRPVELKISEG